MTAAPARPAVSGNVILKLILPGVVANLLGALFTILYFAYFSVHVPDAIAAQAFAAAAGVATLFCISGVAVNYARPEPATIRRYFATGEPAAAALEHLALLPRAAAGIAFRHWCGGGVLFALLYWFDAATGRVFGGGMPAGDAWYVLFGTIGVGGVFSALATFLLLEHAVAAALPGLFPADLLTARAPVRMFGLRTRLIALFLAAGGVPAVTIGVIVLMMRLDLLAAMALLVALFAVLAAIGAALLVARSVSAPVEGLLAAAQRVRAGQLDAAVPVTAADELGELQAGFNRMLRGLRERDYIRDVFGRYVTAQVVDEVLNGHLHLGGETRQATILMSDIRGFTRFAAALPPAEVVAFLNDYLTHMVDSVVAEEGRLDKFIGDGLLAVFGAPQEHADDPQRACRVALRMRAVLAELNASRAARGLAPIAIGIGIHTGPVVAGNIGSDKKMEYTVIGDTVNVASRIEQLTKHYATDILISDVTRAAVGEAFTVRDLPPATVAGKDEPLTVFALVARHSQG
ncbi:MAG TPA: adenylate/guanylate cyclase domain-containing protein [bacterium]|nr:adenylate/guanylate cyclase domain-containing protein [bacterium]